jgi:polysaccharide biosynthesis protein PslG
MKFAVRTFLLACLATLSFSPSPALADGPVAIGLNGHGQLAQNAHIGWVRITYYWRDINPSFGVWNFDGLEAAVEDARARDQQILLILSGAPTWCGGGTNGATPCSIEFWKSYVEQVSSRFAGRIAAYEIWNEPDLSGQAAFGVGWDRNINTYPRYVDYLAEASRIIRRNAPGTLVVGPAMSKSSSTSAAIWQQLEQTVFPDGSASDFLDVISFHHATTRADMHSEDVAWDIHDRIKWMIRYYNPSNGYKPMWVTEFGWRVSGSTLTESTQRVRIKNLLIEMGGGGQHILSGFNIPVAFIYRQHGCDGDDGYGIYRCNQTPRPVVSTYLWTLPFPATQDPSVPRE